MTSWCLGQLDTLWGNTFYSWVHFLVIEKLIKLFFLQNATHSLAYFANLVVCSMEFISWWLFAPLWINELLWISKLWANNLNFSELLVSVIYILSSLGPHWWVVFPTLPPASAVMYLECIVSISIVSICSKRANHYKRPW